MRVCIWKCLLLAFLCVVSWLLLPDQMAGWSVARTAPMTFAKSSLAKRCCGFAFLFSCPHRAQQQRADVKHIHFPFLWAKLCLSICWRVSGQQMLARVSWTLEYILGPCLQVKTYGNLMVLGSAELNSTLINFYKCPLTMVEQNLNCLRVWGLMYVSLPPLTANVH